MHIFYSESHIGDTVALNEEESYHAVKVLRLRMGQEIIITNGMGAWCKAELIEGSHRQAIARVVEAGSKPPRPFNLHIALAPTKNIDRMEWFLEKATECGIDAITPIFCENSERTSIKPERLKKILASAMKQSLRAYLPQLHAEIALKAFLQKNFDAIKMIAHCQNDTRYSISDLYVRGQNTIILIGPEGDFSDEEVHLALQKGFQPVTLGDYRLRTETAGIAACIQLNVLNGLL